MPTIGDYLEGKRNYTIGGGECSHAATEALRATGHDFTYNDSPNFGDYVWGKEILHLYRSGGKLLKSYVRGYPLRRGDIIQYRNVRMTNSTASHHTSIVRTVGRSNGLPLDIFTQNSNSKKFVTVKEVDFTTLTEGWIRVYRPMARKPKSGQFEITVLNLTPATQTLTVKWVDQPKWTPKKFAVGTSSVSCFVTYIGTGIQYRPYFQLDGRTCLIRDAAGYVIKGTAADPLIYYW